MTSIFRMIFLGLAGALLAAYAFFHEINAYPGAERLHRMIEDMPALKAALSLPPVILIAVAGLMMLAIAIYRLRNLWRFHRVANQRRLLPVPAVDDRPSRRLPPSHHDPVDQDFDDDEYGPGESYGAPHRDRYRGNGQADTRRAESYR